MNTYTTEVQHYTQEDIYNAFSRAYMFERSVFVVLVLIQAYYWYRVFKIAKPMDFTAKLATSIVCMADLGFICLFVYAIFIFFFSSARNEEVFTEDFIKTHHLIKDTSK